ncbi:uncharacterized protein BJ212DRAFT_24402 [Suillus subaureus]|uniref:Uncharacterized protein n=1 Tax=Suillus subaureus TaxID=48587 RepID=A0A9P7EPS6_9AGAM|nr:uncharacterized protein BJ212DRAFT_24402 [Suillus subaureus]KAG1827000.1 hypothetical protein BJ212DRAFT_24402 [Suillus subaureus]
MDWWKIDEFDVDSALGMRECCISAFRDHQLPNGQTAGKMCKLYVVFFPSHTLLVVFMSFSSFKENTDISIRIMTRASPSWRQYSQCTRGTHLSRGSSATYSTMPRLLLQFDLAKFIR